MVKNNEIQVIDWGMVDYETAWQRQETILQETIALKKEHKKTNNYLIFVEHPNVYTLGKSGKEENVLLSTHELAQKEISYYKTNRGGDITFHGPGQIVGYPIIDLENFKTDIGWYLRTMEEVIIKVLKEYGITAERSKGETGVWIEPNTIGKERKICAMGVRCSRWVTMHGFALNVNNSLEHFNYIIPCGIVNKKVTSLQQELQKEINISDVKNKIQQQFIDLFSGGH